MGKISGMDLYFHMIVGNVIFGSLWNGYLWIYGINAPHAIPISSSIKIVALVVILTVMVSLFSIFLILLTFSWNPHSSTPSRAVKLPDSWNRFSKKLSRGRLIIEDGEKSSMEVPAPRQMTPELVFGGGVATLVLLIFLQRLATRCRWCLVIHHALICTLYREFFCFLPFGILRHLQKTVTPPQIFIFTFTGPNPVPYKIPAGIP